MNLVRKNIWKIASHFFSSHFQNLTPAMICENIPAGFHLLNWTYSQTSYLGTHKTYREDRVPRKCLLNAPVTVDPSPATPWATATAIIAAINRKKNGDNESLYLHDLNNVIYYYLGLLLRSLCVCTVCLNINNDELFFDAFPFENSFYFISGYSIGLDMVRRSTGNTYSY